jgi:hypothetical protein
MDQIQQHQRKGQEQYRPRQAKITVALNSQLLLRTLSAPDLLQDTRI